MLREQIRLFWFNLCGTSKLGGFAGLISFVACNLKDRKLRPAADHGLRQLRHLSASAQAPQRPEPDGVEKMRGAEPGPGPDPGPLDPDHRCAWFESWSENRGCQMKFFLRPNQREGPISESWSKKGQPGNPVCNCQPCLGVDVMATCESFNFQSCIVVFCFKIKSLYTGEKNDILPRG